MGVGWGRGSTVSVGWMQFQKPEDVFFKGIVAACVCNSIARPETPVESYLTLNSAIPLLP